MASLHIDFSYDDNVKRSINSAKSHLSTRISDYKRIKKSVGNISSSGNLSTANTYIQKKINKLQDKYDDLERFRSAITTFNKNADNAEDRVAKRINTETKQFYKREGIKTGILYTIGSAIGKGAKWLKGEIEKALDAFVTFAKTTWANIKQWYEDNKHWFDIVIDAVCVVVAVIGLVATILTGGTAAALIAGIVFGLWGLAKASTDLVYDVQAYGAYKDGDMEKYEELSNKGLKDAMKEKMGSVGEVLYYGMEIASAVYGIYKLGKSVTQIFKNYKSLYTGNLFKGNTLANMVLSDSTKRAIIISDIKASVLKIIGLDSLNLDIATGRMTVANVISAAAWTLSTFKSVVTATDAGTFMLDTVKITSTIKKIINSGKSAIDVITGDQGKAVSKEYAKALVV